MFFSGGVAVMATSHEQLILDSDRCLREATRLIVARTPITDWPEWVRLPLERAISDDFSEYRVSAYRADAVRRYLARIGLLDKGFLAIYNTVAPRAAAFSVGADRAGDEDLDSTSVEYAKDRLLADLLPSIAREAAHERRP